MSKKKTKKTTAEMTTLRGTEMTVEKAKTTLLAELRVATTAKKTSETKRLRALLRTKCQHFGGLRQRTYVDKANKSTRVVIEKAKATASK